MTSFTGSTAAGRRVALLAAAGHRRQAAAPELGGNAPFLVFDEADLAAAMHGAVAARAYVQRPFYDAFVAGVADLMASVRLGDPFEPGTDIGPLISTAQRERVAGHVDRARGHATVVTGGAAPGFASSSALAKCAYYRPRLGQRPQPGRLTGRGLLVREVHAGQARPARHHGPRPQGLAPDGLRPPEQHT
jgi:betaine-aldehyde dehydrogenase